MDRNGIREFQFLQCRERIVDPSSVIEFHQQCGHGIIDFLNPSHISVEYAHSLVDGNIVSPDDLPFDLVIVFDLHDLIAFPENGIAIGMLLFMRIRWIQITL